MESFNYANFTLGLDDDNQAIISRNGTSFHLVSPLPRNELRCRFMLTLGLYLISGVIMSIARIRQSRILSLIQFASLIYREDTRLYLHELMYDQMC